MRGQGFYNDILAIVYLEISEVATFQCFVLYYLLMKTSNSPNRLILVAGPIGGGKDTVGDYLAQKYNMKHVSAGSLLRAEAVLRGASIPVSREMAQRTHQTLAAIYGDAPVARRALEQFALETANFPGGLVISGLRRTTEIQCIKDNHGLVGYVDAPIENRYERTTHRKRGDDEGSYQSFVERDEQELHGTTPEGKSGIYILGVKAMANMIINNETSLEALYANAERLYSLTA